MIYTIEYEREEDGGWLAEVLEIPGVLVYGETPEEVLTKVQVKALRAIADRIEHCDHTPSLQSITFRIS
ncbi:MAG TPA: type II toxin-antitoxin system HicB family antitoxin [Pyrinomonadaceae bacterium]|jgi:predicted RNase H-like HicB family nuclease